MTSIVKEGNLQKYSTGIFKGWKQRYFTLYSDGHFVIFDHKGGPRAAKFYLPRDCHDIQVGAGIQAKVPQLPDSLTVDCVMLFIARDKRFLLLAPNRPELDSWMRSLNNLRNLTTATNVQTQGTGYPTMPANAPQQYPSAPPIQPHGMSAPPPYSSQPPNAGTLGFEKLNLGGSASSSSPYPPQGGASGYPPGQPYPPHGGASGYPPGQPYPPQGGASGYPPGQPQASYPPATSGYPPTNPPLNKHGKSSYPVSAPPQVHQGAYPVQGYGPPPGQPVGVPTPPYQQGYARPPGQPPYGYPQQPYGGYQTQPGYYQQPVGGNYPPGAYQQQYGTPYGQPVYQKGHSSKSGGLGGLGGLAGAAGLGSLVGGKKVKKIGKHKKLVGGAAAALVGGYALSKVGRRGSWGSWSSGSFGSFGSCGSFGSFGSFGS